MSPDASGYYTIEPLGPQHDRAAFSCGELALDTYLQQRAMQDVRRDLATCYVLCERGGTTILGYYTLSATSVEPTALPAALAKTAGRYPLIPAVLLGRLAVASRFQGQGLSRLLLVNAMRRALRTGVGVKLILVDALGEQTATFYERRGFRRLPDTPLRLYLLLQWVREQFPGEGGAQGEGGP